MNMKLEKLKWTKEGGYSGSDCVKYTASAEQFAILRTRIGGDWGFYGVYRNDISLRGFPRISEAKSYVEGLRGEVVRVFVEIGWGRKFNGEYLAETPGVGCYVQVMEAPPASFECGFGFRGCPLGSGSTVELALRDFVNRGAAEYRGTMPLVLGMIEIVRTVDFRKRPLTKGD